MITSGPKKFVEWFNEKYPGAYRRIGEEDVKDMTVGGLIHRHGYYGGLLDGEIVRAVLQYEQRRESRSLQQEQVEKALTCKICGQPLPETPERKTGRPREYCSDCEPQRIRQRQKSLRHRRRQLVNGDRLVIGS